MLHPKITKNFFIHFDKEFQMTSPVTTEEFLLPYEWPGSYFIGEEEIDAVTKTLLARSPYRFYGHD